MGVTCRTTATSLRSIGVVSPFRLRTCNIAAMGCGHSIRVCPMLTTVFRNVCNCYPCGSPASVNIGVTNGYVYSSRIYYRTSHRRVVHHCCRSLGHLTLSRTDGRRICALRLLVGRTGIDMGSHHIIAMTGRITRRHGYTIVTLRLTSNEVIANGAASLLKPTDTILLGTVGRLNNVTSRVRLVSPACVGPVRGLGAHCLNDDGPHLRVSRILVTLSVYTTASDLTGLTLRGLPRLGNYRTRSAIVLARKSFGMFGGLNIRLAGSPVCRAGWTVGGRGREFYFKCGKFVDHYRWEYDTGDCQW